MNSQPIKTTRNNVTRRAFIRSGAIASLLPSLVNGQEAGNKAEMEWVKPKGLKPGDTIALVAPAGPADRELVLSYKKHLERDGFRVRLNERMLDRKKEYLAGEDSERADELNQAIRDPVVRAIFPVRGGFGLTRILDRIDYDSLRSDPKVITGYSDLTALHLAIARRSRMISFHSPMPMSNLGQSDLPEYSFALRSYERMLYADRFPIAMTGSAIEVPIDDPIQRINAGKTEGRLIGGNLSLVCATLGTSYAIEPSGVILFLEDVNEAPYRVDRLFSQLRLAGILDAIAGIVVGKFTTKDPSEEKQIDRVIREYLEQVRCPAVMNFPVGHVPKNATLPHGAKVELNVDTGVLTLLEEPCLR